MNDNDGTYLADRIKQRREVITTVILLPHYFEFNVHADTSIHLPTPWFSGMAQGEVLMVLIRLFEFTVRTHPTSYFACFTLGTYYENTRNKKRALDCYKKAIEINPNYQPALEALKSLKNK